MASSKPEEVSTSAATKHIEFEASIFSALESSLSSPLSLNLPPRIDVQHIHEKRKSRLDSKVSHRSSLHRSSSFVFRTLPPIRRIPSLQVPSLTDITNPHSLSTPRRSLHQISETEATTYKLKLPLTLSHPNSPYVPWEAPVRQKILCPTLRPRPEEQQEGAEDAPIEPEGSKGEKKPIKHIWTALKLAPKNLKNKCQRLLNTRTKDSNSPSPSTFDQDDDLEPESLDSKEQVITYTLDGSHHDSYSPTASFRSSETNTLAAWLAERQRKFLDKDCDSAKIMSIEDYERLGSWVKHGGEHPFSSRSSYYCSYVDGDTVSSIIVLESEHDLTASSTTEHSSSFVRPPLSPSHRPAFGPKRIAEEDRLSRIVHRSSLRSYLAERSFQSVQNAHNIP